MLEYPARSGIKGKSDYTGIKGSGLEDRFSSMCN